MATVALLCRLGPAGVLNDCWVLDENPAGLGLGQAAVQSAAFTRFNLQIGDGAKLLNQPIGIDVVFDLGGLPPYRIIPHLDGVGRPACELKSIGGRALPNDYRDRCLNQIADAERRSP